MSVLVDVNGICYEVFVPKAIMKKMDKHVIKDEEVEFITYHYYQVDPSRSIPMLIGFFNEVEREFFEQFITVSGVGPKAACKALTLPFSTIADAIDKGDSALLKTLPGIGDQRAREIIAKLQSRVGKYGLIQDKADREGGSESKSDVKSEAVSVLLQLQYKKRDAEQMVEDAFLRNTKIKNCEELLNEVYKQKIQG